MASFFNCFSCSAVVARAEDQSHGQVIATEYAGKFWMMADAISRNRTDGSLVRLITPMNDGEETQMAFPQIDARACGETGPAISDVTGREILETHTCR